MAGLNFLKFPQIIWQIHVDIITLRCLVSYCIIGIFLAILEALLSFIDYKDSKSTSTRFLVLLLVWDYKVVSVQEVKENEADTNEACLFATYDAQIL